MLEPARHRRARARHKAAEATAAQDAAAAVLSPTAAAAVSVSAASTRAEGRASSPAPAPATAATSNPLSGPAPAPTQTPTQTPTRPRLASLDVLRGLTVAGMILVNNQGDGAHAFPGTAHAKWHGMTPADLVFPAFLFIVGASMAYAVRRGAPGIHCRVARRATLLFGLGIVLNAFPTFELGELRVMGVLQRIGLAYLVAALLVLHTPVRKQVRVAAVALLAYWAMLLLPVPGHGAFVMAPDANVAGTVDRDVLGPSHVYKNGGYDPEGLLSTIPAVVTVLAGYWTARRVKWQSVSSGTSRQLAAAGVVAVAAGLAWSVVLPLNKRLWTSSFVVVAAGCSLLLFAACYEWVEVRGRPMRWAAVFGLNAVVAYVASEQVGRWMDAWGWRRWLYDHVFSVAGLHVGSLLYGVAFTAVWWAACWMLWRRRIFVKI